MECLCDKCGNAKDVRDSLSHGQQEYYCYTCEHDHKMAHVDPRFHLSARDNYQRKLTESEELARKILRYLGVGMEYVYRIKSHFEIDERMLHMAVENEPRLAFHRIRWKDNAGLYVTVKDA